METKKSMKTFTQAALNAFEEKLKSRATLLAEKEKVDASFADRLFVRRTHEVRQYLKDYRSQLIDSQGGLRYWHAWHLIEGMLDDAHVDPYRKRSVERR